ncbi:MAG TPA: RodZ domain-containing protein [Casimicrobiaceae bacterium]|nr:RodZ domain-containing protein [Casimicrobiaceae bacterium]
MDLEAQPAGGSVPEPDVFGGAGAQLRAAREAAGLSLDQVAQQLKLAPRQVKALEEENFGVLPGRTFTRGFMRNYARLLNLDPDLLVAHLPDAAHAPSLEPPPLHSTGTTMAELPTAHARAPSFGRWLIPLVLIASIVAAAGYEWYRGRPASVAAPRATDAAPPPNTSTSSTPLPNPVAPDSGAPGLVAPPATSGVPAPPGTPQPERSPQGAAPGAANAAAEAALVIRYEGPSWTEIRDQRGQTLIARLVATDSVEPFDGAPPFSVVIGNAKAVTLLYHGQPVDLAPYTRLNVARLVLR